MAKTGGILLCAGFGSRLAPLTEVVPKPAIPFCGLPMAHYARAALERAGVAEMGMNVHHLPERMIEAMDGGRWMDRSREMHISREDGGILGTGGGAARLAEMMPGCDRFVIYHGDVLCGADISEALESHVASGAQVSLVVLPRPESVRENVRQSLGMIGVVDHEIVCIRDWYKNDCIVEFSPRCFSGIHIVERSVLEAIANRGSVCLVTEVYREMLDRGETIHACEPSGPVFFADVGTPATYLAAQRACLRSREYGDGPGLPVLSEGKKLYDREDPSVSFGVVNIGDKVRIEGNVCLNPGASVSGDVCLQDEMVCAEGGIKLDGAWICGDASAR